MHTLFINLASQEALVACVSDDSVTAQQSSLERVSDHQLLPIIENCLSDAGIAYADLGRIACIVGPGGFTSLRVGVTCANVLCDQLEIPGAGIHLSELYRARMDNGERIMDNCFWLHSTKRDQLFIRGGEHEEPTLITIEQLHQQLTTNNQQLVWCGELIDEHRSLIKTDSVELTSIKEVLLSFLSEQDYTTDLMTPWYGRGW